ncbi:undecaprenyl-diphosphatase [Paraburkholderia sp. GAS448]|jgi:undecaprenyl-diphosphatase
MLNAPIAMNNLEAFNRALFLTINGTTSTPVWLIDVAVLIGNDLIYLIPLLLTGMWLSGDEKQRSAAVRACLVALLALGINQLIGIIWPHPRPSMIGLGHTFLSHSADSSFPSDHGTVFASVALTLLFEGLLWTGGSTLLIGAAVAWARVFLGVHFPLDMLGAVLVAYIACALITPLWRLGGAPVTRFVIVVYRKLLAWPIGFGWLRP